MTSDLIEPLHQIERELDAGIYSPGPWASFLRVVERQSQTERRALTSDVTRVSNKLHRRNHRTTVPLRTGLCLELLATVAGVLLLAFGLDRLSAAAVLIAGAILTVTLQPLIKMTVGYLAGIRYTYFYFGGIEPRVKMQYGTYLAATRWRRVMLHLSGTVGSPLAFCWVAMAVAKDMPDTAAVCWALCWIQRRKRRPGTAPCWFDPDRSLNSPQAKPNAPATTQDAQCISPRGEPRSWSSH